jgi:hypothetical protein
VLSGLFSSPCCCAHHACCSSCSASCGGGGCAGNVSGETTCGCGGAAPTMMPTQTQPMGPTAAPAPALPRTPPLPKAPRGDPSAFQSPNSSVYSSSRAIVRD